MNSTLVHAHQKGSLARREELLSQYYVYVSVCQHQWRSQDFRYGGLGACFPRKILDFRPSEIVSGAIWIHLNTNS